MITHCRIPQKLEKLGGRYNQQWVTDGPYKICRYIHRPVPQTPDPDLKPVLCEKTTSRMQSAFSACNLLGSCLPRSFEHAWKASKSHQPLRSKVWDHEVRRWKTLSKRRRLTNAYNAFLRSTFFLHFNPTTYRRLRR